MASSQREGFSLIQKILLHVLLKRLHLFLLGGNKVLGVKVLLAQGVRAEKQVDHRAEFQLLIVFTNGIKQQKPRFEGHERIGIRDVDLHAVAPLTRELGKGGGEADRAEVDTGQVHAAHSIRQCVAVDKGSADQLKGPRRSPALGDVCSLKQHRADIDERRLIGG